MNYRAAGVSAGIPPPDPVPPTDRARSVAHLAHTVLDALSHVSRHSMAALDAPDAKSQRFNMEHMTRHVAEAIEHQRKLISVLCAYNPDVAKEIDSMQKLSDPASMAPVPEAPRNMRSADYDVNGLGPEPVLSALC